MARTRLIKPEFFTDTRMARLSPPVRLFYIGLWTQSDDAGFFEWEPDQLGLALAGHLGPVPRSRLVEDALAKLVDEKRVQALPCGHHGVIPTMPDHRIKGGEQLFTIRKRHERRCVEAASRAGYVGPPEGYVAPGYVGPTDDYIPDSHSESGSVSQSRGRAGREAMERAASAAGGFVANIASERARRRQAASS